MTSSPMTDDKTLAAGLLSLKPFLEAHHCSTELIDEAAERIAMLEGALEPLLKAAEGLAQGADWNGGTHAKLHGYRQKLLDAIPNARAFLTKEGK